jgi:arginase
MLTNNKLRIIGMPTDLGASRRGVDMGASAMRIAQLGERLSGLGYDVEDIGNIPVAIRESVKLDDAKMRYLPEILASSKLLKEQTYNCMKQGKTPLIIGGDHSLSIGSIAGIAKYFHEKGERIGVIWIDAHGDINTPETTISGNIHGMPLAHILGKGHKQILDLFATNPIVDPARVVLIGIRDLDPGERATIKDLGVRTFTMRDIDELGMRTVMQEAIRTCSSGTAGIHVSFDVDGIDPTVAPGVGTPVRGGLSFREGHLVMEMLHDSQKIVSMEVAEVNPVLDIANQTADLAVEFVLSAFGKKIL